jgi:hypothetical protein
LKFIEERGLPGWAPTQGHIPSGVPYLGFARDDIMEDRAKRCMIVGKGSLFLGRMTNLFDGVSFILQENSGAGMSGEHSNAVSEHAVKRLIAEALREMARVMGADS